VEWVLVTVLWRGSEQAWQKYRKTPMKCSASAVQQNFGANSEE